MQGQTIREVSPGTRNNLWWKGFVEQVKFRNFRALNESES